MFACGDPADFGLARPAGSLALCCFREKAEKLIQIDAAMEVRVRSFILIGAPDTIRTCETFAFGGQRPTPPIPEQGIYSFARMGCCKPPATTPLRCLAKPRYGSFMTSTADGN